jgi:hypothetical protein
MLIGETFTITFPAQFDAADIIIDDVDLSVDSVDQTLEAVAGAGEWGVTGFSGNTLTFETPDDAGTASSSDIVVLIGTNAAGPGVNQIVNPSATSSYEIVVGGTMADSGRTRVAIIENVLVTATINTSLLFEVFGVADGATVNGSAVTTSTTTTNTTLPFETLSAGVPKTLAQDLEVTTNAANGYVVTVYQDANLQSGTGADIDGFVDGNYTNTPQGWVAPSNVVSQENTWGHWGLTSEDATTTRAAEFGSDEWVAASTTPIIIMSHDSPSDGTTQGVGAARIGYQIEISALQEAGDDYNTTLTYVATPTF